MTPDLEPDLKLEIAHVLTIDVVAYSTLLIDEQTRLMAELVRTVKSTPRFREAAADKLISLPTGDGMALVFLNDAEAPIECAMQIAASLKEHPEIRLRMGIHSGPVNTIRDVNDRPNLAGAGIDMAQRVMDCGDAGHILVSKRVADDLAPYPRWNRHLHDLGECEVKHRRKVSLFNFYSESFGNRGDPAKAQMRAACGHRRAKSRRDRAPRLGDLSGRRSPCFRSPSPSKTIDRSSVRSSTSVPRRINNISATELRSRSEIRSVRCPDSSSLATPRPVISKVAIRTFTKLGDAFA